MIKVIGKDGNDYTLTKHQLGFLQVTPIPEVKTLNEYYAQKYYQNPTVATYALNYSKEELELQTLACDITEIIYDEQFPNKEKSLYDIGCGEGFFMQGLMNKGWKVYGVDYSLAGIEKHNPRVAEFVSIGDAVADIEKCIANNQKFNLVNLGNVLEHVTDPIWLLQKIQTLLLPEGILRIVVPNDNSALQELLFQQGACSYDWIHPPDHLSYFNFHNLTNVLDATGYEVVKMLGDFPVELFLSNENSNYIKDKSKGKAAHKSRVDVSSLIAKTGTDNYIKWSEGIAAASIGRTCIAFSIKKLNDGLL